MTMASSKVEAENLALKKDIDFLAMVGKFNFITIYLHTNFAYEVHSHGNFRFMSRNPLIWR